MEATILLNSTDVNRTEWLNFVSDHPNGTIFQTPFMFDVYLRSRGYEPFLVALEVNNKLVALVVAAVITDFSWPLNRLTSRAIVQGGPLVAAGFEEYMLTLVAAYDELIRQKAIYSQIRNLHDTSEWTKDLGSVGYTYEDHLDIHIDLQVAPDQLWNNLKRSARKAVRKSVREGARFDEIVSRSEFLESVELIRDLYKRIRLPCPDDSFFENAYRVLYPESILKCFGVYFREKLIAVHFGLAFNGMLYDWYAGSVKDNWSQLRPNDLMYWEMVKWANQQELRVFDMGGAGKPDIPYGVRDHKLKFGGELVCNGRYFKVHRPTSFRVGRSGFEAWKNLSGLLSKGGAK